MRRLLATVLLLTWGLWMGALGGVFLAARTAFDATDRTTAGAINTVMFSRFERMELVVGAAALVATIGLLTRRTSDGRQRFAPTAVASLLSLSIAAALISHRVVSPRIEAMRTARETDTPAFKSQHARSGILYVARWGMLGLAAVWIPAAIRKPE